MISFGIFSTYWIIILSKHYLCLWVKVKVLNIYTCIHTITCIFVKWNGKVLSAKKCYTFMVYIFDSLFNFRKELIRFSYSLRMDRGGVNRNDNWRGKLYCTSMFYFLKKSFCSIGIKLRAMCMLGKHCTTQPCPWLCVHFYNQQLFIFQGHLTYRDRFTAKSVRKGVDKASRRTLPFNFMGSYINREEKIFLICIYFGLFLSTMHHWN